MKAFVVLSNDAVFGCVIDDKAKAIALMGELVEVERQKQIKFYGGDNAACRAYIARCRWHIETTEVTE